MIYHRAEDLDDALELIHQHPGYLLLCGSTDVAVQLNDQNPVQGLIDIGGLNALRSIEMDSEDIRIGALATITEIMESEAIRTHLPLLVAASEVFASHQIRNLATLGGNIANASPAADLTAVLLVLKARLTLGSKQGRREIALDELFCGYKCTKLDHEMILGITIPLQKHRWYYRKVGARERLNIAKVSLAVVKNSGGYCISGASLNPYALRFRQVEELLNSGNVSDEKLEKALAEDIAPSGSFRSTKAYRTRVAFNMVKEAFSRLETS